MVNVEISWFYKGNISSVFVLYPFRVCCSHLSSLTNAIELFYSRRSTTIKLLQKWKTYFSKWYSEIGKLVRYLLHVKKHPMKSLLSVRLSICPSVHPSQSFLKIRSLVFFDIVHDDSWPWHLVTDKARFFDLWSEFGTKGPKSSPKWGL